MSDLRFDWDPRKASENKRNHKVTFEEASGVFLDQNAMVYFDPDHSQEEDRYLIHGISRSLRVLIVCYCYRGDDDVIRIISARLADKKETQHYFRR